MNNTSTNALLRAPANGRRAQRIHITDRDRDLLNLVAAHRFVFAEHAHEWLGTTRSIAYRRLHLLTHAGLLRYERIFHAQPGVYTVTNGGLAIAYSPLQRPTIDLRLYRHEANVPALWLAARAGVFGPAAAIHTEREVVHHDTATSCHGQAPLGVPLGGFDRAGRLRLHSPDVLVSHADDRRTALELELSLKGRGRLDEILRAYHLDDSVQRVVYLADQHHVADAVNRVADLLAPDKVTVVRVSLPLSATQLRRLCAAANVGRTA